ncbi:hypothetical protein BC830DRAFT_1063632 [Chytriomyces sp. MP71]|nr:hypothetical protein BC830DRAFT_1063632 [Chytriomyces sp. MP71]
MTLSKATATRTTRIRRTSTLILHECTHPECSHTASRRNNLIAHMKTHSRDRPRNFICKYHGCGRAFLRSGDLQRHGGSHDVDSWSTCFGCGRTFSRLDSLKRHQTNTQKSVCALAGNT